MNLENYEGTGPHFNLETYLEARKVCIEVVDAIIKKIEPGMTEKIAQSLIKDTFKQAGAVNFWHPSKFRFASYTEKIFSEISDPEIICKAGDLCFVDVGPIINQHEADYGRSFIIGDGDPGKVALVNASESIFLDTAKFWKSQKRTGLEIYDFASEQADKLGYTLNAKMAGHRLGDFPHKVYSSKKLNKLEKVPVENLWVLEIHLIDEKNHQGAFFEDILF